MNPSGPVSIAFGTNSISERAGGMSYAGRQRERATAYCMIHSADRYASPAKSSRRKKIKKEATVMPKLRQSKYELANSIFRAAVNGNRELYGYRRKADLCPIFGVKEETVSKHLPSLQFTAFAYSVARIRGKRFTQSEIGIPIFPCYYKESGKLVRTPR